MSRFLDFDDGFTSATTPSVIETGVAVKEFQTFANDTAYETDKGSAGDEGDVYYNSTLNLVRNHNGTAWRSLVDEDSTQTLSNKNLVDATLSGTTTIVNSTNLDVTDKNITINDGGNDASSEGAGLTIERTGTDGSVVYEDALASKFKAGPVGSEVELVNISATQTLSNKVIAAASNTITMDIDDLDDVNAPSPTDTQVLTWVNASSEWQAQDAAGGGGSSFAILSHTASSSTDGGVLTSGAWSTRPIAEDYDPDSLVTVTSNAFTPISGTYLLESWATGYRCNLHKSKIENITDTSDTLIGSSAHSTAGTGSATISVIHGVFTTNGTKEFELQHRSSTTTGSQGMGNGVAFGVDEVHSQIKLTKIG